MDQWFRVQDTDMRIMLDTMVYDQIVADPELSKLVVERSADRSLVVISTHIQESKKTNLLPFGTKPSAQTLV